ncbi:DNA-binding response regulator [Kyrpidia spormannii]|uniref:DNA-binding response regulator n=1 Tax=Kyrpidia spormannii TaxID=2055160 RepID=A0A2K8N5F4_9BACL|nr:response regulator transcription factor [Kyrpidia sp.]ATY84037.1 DNA-binding response regulator [Kyrpidia spormannii]MCL6575126.1 response regulator transcription factor [Kyrpidia sp.]
MVNRKPRNILIVEDEQKLRDVIASYLEKAGYRPLQAARADEAWDLLQQEPADLVILDLLLPDMPGEELCKKIRAHTAVPILMLTAKAGETDRIRGLSLGADDYVTKPFSPRELVARIQAILRRVSPEELLADTVTFRDGELVIDAGRQKVYRKGELVPLTPFEYRLLLTLARHPDRPLTREELILKLGGFDYEGDVRTIDQHIKNLRQKIEPDPKNPTYILTVFGVGYKFAPGSP